MREIIIDETLTPQNSELYVISPANAFGYEADEFKAVTDLEIKQKNYLGYLGNCWKQHFGAIISPTILWNMILSNLAYKVNKEPEKFRKYFSESDEKIEIKVNQPGNLISPELLIKGLAGRVPSSMIDDCFPEFSTDTEMSTIANYTAFLDMVSPYYNYSMFCCGIPKVKVLGTKEDWSKLMFTLGMITATLPECKDYLLTVANRVGKIIDDNCDFSDIYRLERCGSGGQVEVEGWIKEFFIEQPSINYPENFISCISKIDYKNYNEDGKMYRMYAGLFSSEIEDGYLVPSFNTQYFEALDQ